MTSRPLYDGKARGVLWLGRGQITLSDPERSWRTRAEPPFGATAGSWRSQAALTQPVALDQARQALAADPARLLIRAVAVTTETNPALAAAIMDAAAALDTAALIPLAEAIHYPTVALAGVYAAVARQITSTLPPAADPAERATWLSTLRAALSQLGRPAEALPAEEEAVAIRRVLAAASPDRYRPDLARSLTNLGIIFSELSRRPTRSRSPRRPSPHETRRTPTSAAFTRRNWRDLWVGSAAHLPICHFTCYCCSIILDQIGKLRNVAQPAEAEPNP